jgi:hypothetical protein
VGKKMKIINGYPPNYDEICEVFDIRGRKGIIFTWGTALYNPDNGNIPRHLMIHEEIHEAQQRTYGIKAWWEKYLTDAEFRLKQELEAYRQQYLFICGTHTREYRRPLLTKLARDLSGAIYGNLITFEEAKKEISA